MDYKIALETLNIDLGKAEWRGNHLSVEYLKKCYHKMALKNHPDKNGNSPEATFKFQKINEAYDFLKREILLSEKDMSDLTENETESSYETILKTFIFGIVKGEFNDIISSIIQQIVVGYKKISIKLFEGLNKENAIRVFSFLSKYKNTLNISDETINQVREIIMEKCKDDCVYILNPSIDDLLENNIYKLEIDKTLYFVPLWHDELYFDGSGCDVIVKCIPNLPPNIDIDENNNLLVDLEIPLSVSLLNTDTYSFKLGKKEFHIQVSNLKLERVQYVSLQNQGISEIDENDMYNVADKKNIHLKVTFV
jgi:DnaJ-class molecular chaperone